MIDRKQGESILIAGEIKIVILRTGSRVRLGVECPREVPIEFGSKPPRENEPDLTPESESP